MTRKRPCIVVLGSSSPAKASVVNELFNKSVLPVLWNEQGYVPWRTVRFKYGSKTSASLAIHGDFELLGKDEVIAHGSGSNTLAAEDLQVQHMNSNENDLAHSCAVLDIRMKSRLLAETCQVVVAQSFDGRESLEDVYRKCTADVLPIVIYAVDSSVFSQQVGDCAFTIDHKAVAFDFLF